MKHYAYFGAAKNFHRVQLVARRFFPPLKITVVPQAMFPRNVQMILPAALGGGVCTRCTQCSVCRQFVAALSELQSPPGATPPQLVGYSCQGQAAQNCGAWIVILEVGRGGPGVCVCVFVFID